MPNPFDDTLVNQDVCLDDLGPILLARPYSSVQQNLDTRKTSARMTHNTDAWVITVGLVPGSNRSDALRTWKSAGGPGTMVNERQRSSALAICAGISC